MLRVRCCTLDPRADAVNRPNISVTIVRRKRDPSEINAGEQVLVRLNVNKMVLLVYTVRYCIPTQIGQYRAGARFTGYAANSFQGDLDTVVTALAGDS